MPPKKKKASPRKVRHSEFEQSATGTAASHDILLGAFQQLACALMERPNVLGTENNHYAPQGASAVILFVTALDAWLSEQVGLTVAVQARPPAFKKVADKPLWVKYKALCRLGKIQALPAKKDLLFIVSLRHEVAHFLPREARRSRYYQALKRRGLLLPETVLFDYGLNNYATAYWVGETVQRITANLGPALAEVSPVLSGTADNFLIQPEIVAPANLANSQWKKVGHLCGAPPKDELQNIGRNGPCWCGSGKKYKNCHEQWMVGP